MPTVAVVGASKERQKFGNKAVRAYLKQGWTVFPVNPREPTIEGLPTHASLVDVPRPIDRVTFYVPPSVGLGLLDQVAEVAPGELFLNPGTDDPTLLERARELGLSVVVGCAILDIGESPGAL